MFELSSAQLLGYILYAGALVLIAIGLFVIVARQHAIRILLGLSLLESGVNLVLVAAGFRENAAAPIITGTIKQGSAMVDPVPQALILTTIVIGVGVLALALAMCIEVQRRYGTLNMRKLAAILEQKKTRTTTVPASKPAPASDSGLASDFSAGKLP
jgi:multicomponent Na+:H+ antiporter subunit C